MNFTSTIPVVLHELPQHVAIDFNHAPALDDIRVVLERSGESDVQMTLDVRTHNNDTVTVMIPARLAACGAGEYDIVVYDECIECGRQRVILESDCKLLGASIKRQDFAHHG